MDRKVLVADDEPIFRSLMSEFLGGMGCSVLEAEDGQEAVEVYEKERPQVVFLDIRMPRKDGLEALREIKEIDPEALVVVITASTTEGIKKTALAQGVFDYIHKPVTYQRLESIMERLGLSGGA